MHRVRIADELDVSIVEGAGELDAYAGPDLSRAFQELAGRRKVVADLERVSFLDSTALGLIVRGVRGLSGGGTVVRVVLPRGTAKRIFEITRLDDHLPISASRESAVAELGEPTVATPGPSAGASSS